jgi:hypothetical protein
LIIEQFTHGIGTEWCLPEQILFEFSANQFHLGSSKHRMKQNLDLHFIKIRGSNFAFRSVFVAFSFFKARNLANWLDISHFGQLIQPNRKILMGKGSD